MNSKKLFQLVAVLIGLTLLLTACAQPTAAPAATAAPVATAVPAKVYTYADMTVGFIQTGSEGGWRAANTASFKETAETLGINLKFYDCRS
jgi:ABC-type sugar transport system substrate-binding protein